MTDADTSTVLAINAPVAHLLSPLDAERLCQLRSWAAYAQVVELDARVAAFVLVFAPGSEYDSHYYRWFAERYPDGYLYLDRFAVAPDVRRRGVGTFIYDAMEEHARPGRLLCEVNVEPPNEPSLAFHAKRGYVEVGRFDTGDGKVTSMLERELR